jgi:hypothetical protein
VPDVERTGQKKPAGHADTIVHGRVRHGGGAAKKKGVHIRLALAVAVPLGQKKPAGQSVQPHLLAMMQVTKVGAKKIVVPLVVPDVAPARQKYPAGQTVCKRHHDPG